MQVFFPNAHDLSETIQNMDPCEEVRKPGTLVESWNPWRIQNLIRNLPASFNAHQIQKNIPGLKY